MSNLNPSGCLTSASIPLVSLHDLIGQYRSSDELECIAKIKFANLHLLGHSQVDLVDHRTRGYFLKLKELGILDGANLVDESLIHEVNGQVSKLVGVAMPDGLTYYLHLMSSDKVVNQALRALETCQQPISTLTGICLFGSGVDTAITNTGERLPVSEVGGLLPEIPEQAIETIEITRRISLYETYKISHFSRLLNALNQSCRRGFGDAYLMMPEDQYPLYLLPAYLEGKVSSEVFQQWTHETRRRVQGIFRLFAKRVSVPLKLLPSPLKLVSGHVVSEVAAHRIPSLAWALEVLGNEDRLWEALLSEPDNVPHSWRELKLLSYVRGVMEAATDAAAKGNFLVTVDDISEKPMANAYAKVRRKLRRHDVELPRVLGLYAPASIVAADRAKNSYLYGHIKASGSEKKAVLRAYRPLHSSTRDTHGVP